MQILYAIFVCIGSSWQMKWGFGNIVAAICRAMITIEHFWTHLPTFFSICLKLPVVSWVSWAINCQRKTPVYTTIAWPKLGAAKGVQIKAKQHRKWRGRLQKYSIVEAPSTTNLSYVNYFWWRYHWEKKNVVWKFFSRL